MNKILTKELNEAWDKLDKLYEESNLNEAKKMLCLISDRAKGFKKVEGTILDKDFFAYKNKYTGWTITDKASGLMLKNNFKTLADAKDYLKTLTPEELEKINEVRSTEKYKEQCAKLAAANIEDYELYEDYCCSVFEALEEDEQENLTDYIEKYKQAEGLAFILSEYEQYIEKLSDVSGIYYLKNIAKPEYKNFAYIGQSVDLYIRLRNHVSRSRNIDNRLVDGNKLIEDSKLHRAIHEYGADKFLVEILKTFPDRNIQKLNEAEKDFIAKKHTYTDPDGYNLTEGGDSTTHLNKIKTLDQLNAIRQLIKTSTLPLAKLAKSEELKEIINDTLDESTIRLVNYGRGPYKIEADNSWQIPIRPDDLKELLVVWQNRCNKKAVIRLDADGNKKYYATAVQAASELSNNPKAGSDIHKAIDGRKYSNHKYHGYYWDETQELPFDTWYNIYLNPGIEQY